MDLGNHPIHINYVRKAGDARLQLIWESNFFIAEPVPSSVLFHAELRAFDIQKQVDAGQLLVEELNCVACHKTSSTMLTPRVGPSLNRT